MLKWSDGMLQVSAQVPELCVLFHESVQALSKHFLAKERRHVYITPTSYLELIHSYKTLLNKKQNEVGRLLIHASCSMHMFWLQEAQHVLLSTTLVWCKQALMWRCYRTVWAWSCLELTAGAYRVCMVAICPMLCSGGDSEETV